MQSFVTFLCFCFIAVPIQAFWLSSSAKNVDAKFSVSETCTQLANKGDCGFFDCFEERLPCGSDGFAVSYGKKYCQKFRENSHLFTPQGNTFIQNLTVCQMKKFIPSYSQNKLECNQHYDDSFVKMGECYLQSGFCDVILSNFIAMASTIESTDFTNYRMVREVFKAAKQCPTDLTSGLIGKYMFFKR